MYVNISGEQNLKKINMDHKRYSMCFMKFHITAPTSLMKSSEEVDAEMRFIMRTRSARSAGG